MPKTRTSGLILFAVASLAVVSLGVVIGLHKPQIMDQVANQLIYTSAGAASKACGERGFYGSRAEGFRCNR